MAAVAASRRLDGSVLTGRVLRGIPVLLLLMDGLMKLAKPQPVVEATLKLGLPESSILPLGLVLLACTALYLAPRTAILGAVLLTGYLGGAVATHVRAESPAFSLAFPLLLGAMLWGGLAMRDARVRGLLG